MTWQEGENVGPYRIIAQLGQGGMATVYKAYHPQLDRFVAIKVMHESFLEDQSFHARFEREARIVAKLEHPNIIPIYDYSEYKNQPYLVMKFVEGKTLKGMLQQGAIPLDEILLIMDAVSGALSYAHQKGVLHRDIKPSNIVIDKDNTPYLTDFGLARIAQAGESTMSQDMLLGTPHYISPEQARGEKNLDARTDIYSLGVVLYELVVGRVPFSADTPYAIIHDHIYTPLPLPTKVNPEIPFEVETVLLKALAKSPDDRYESATAMIEAFRSALAEANVESLDASRVSVAAVSLARLREAQNREIADQYRTPTPAPVPAAYVTPSAKTATEANHHPVRGRRWVFGGMSVFVFVCILSTAITVSALDRIGKLAELQPSQNGQAALYAPPEATAPPTPPPTPSPTPDSQISYDNIPLMSVAEANAYRSQNPNDPVAYLVQANALWHNNQATEARSTLRAGYALAGDQQVPYLMAAAEIADSAGQVEAAAAYYLLAYDLAKDNPDQEPTVHAAAGAYLYDHASDLTHPEAITTALRALLGDAEARDLGQSPLVRVAMAHSMVLNGRLQLAQGAIQNLRNDNYTGPDIQLVDAEIQRAKGENERALSMLQQLIQDGGTPQWIRDRASALLNSP